MHKPLALRDRLIISRPEKAALAERDREGMELFADSAEFCKYPFSLPAGPLGELRSTLGACFIGLPRWGLLQLTSRCSLNSALQEIFPSVRLRRGKI